MAFTTLLQPLRADKYNQHRPQILTIMINAQIQIQFPTPGQWDKLNMAAVYRDADGYTHSDTYTQDNIPTDQVPALATAVTAIASMGEDWQATQVWAQLGDDSVINNPAADEGAVEIREAVLLTVEAIKPSGGRRIFTSSEYMQFVITDSAAVAFFKHFTDCVPINS